MNRSHDQDKIAPALVKAWRSMKNPPKTADNPFFKSKYAPLPEMLEHVKPALSDNGLCVMQDGGGGVLIVHESGQWIEFPGMPLVPAKEDPQGYVAALTYARRATLAAALGIAADDDDDGNAVSGRGQPAERSTGQSRASGTITEKQAKYLHVLCDLKTTNPAETVAGIKAKFGVESFKDIPHRPGKALIDKMSSMPDLPKDAPPEDEFDLGDVPF